MKEMNSKSFSRLILLLLLFVIIWGCKSNLKNGRIPMAPEMNRRPKHFQSIDSIYSWGTLNRKFSEETPVDVLVETDLAKKGFRA